MNPDDPERRRDPRADEVGIHAIVFAHHSVGVAFSIENISVGGAALVGPLALSTGERVQILFRVEGTPIEVSADVVRVETRSDRVAVSFVDVQDSARELIRRLVVKVIELARDRVETE